MNQVDLDSHFDTPKMVLRVAEILPHAPEWCGTNYMKGYDIDKVLEYLDLEEMPEGCGCGCRGTKKLALALDLDIGCSLQQLFSEDEYWTTVVDEEAIYHPPEVASQPSKVVVPAQQIQPAPVKPVETVPVQ